MICPYLLIICRRHIFYCAFFALNTLAFPDLTLAETSSALYDVAVTCETQSRLAQIQVPARSAQDKAEDTARKDFDTFTREWMRKLVKTEDFQKKKMMRMTQTEAGFVAEYTGYLPHRYTVVKPTESKATPFVGVLTYRKKKMRCVGKTKEAALEGPFEQAGTSQVSEIFRFTKGKWIY